MMKAIIIQAHRPDSDQMIACSAGELVEFERRETPFPGWIWCTDGQGRQAWVPEAYATIIGTQCRFVRDYISRELEVDAGESVSILEAVSGWAWVVNEEGEKGWVPLGCLSPTTQGHA